VLEHPLVLGRERAGVIQDGSRRGERVATDLAIPCGAYRSCLDGYRNLWTAIVFPPVRPMNARIQHFKPYSPQLTASQQAFAEPPFGAVCSPFDMIASTTRKR
jgi:hypothetical protein